MTFKKANFQRYKQKAETFLTTLSINSMCAARESIRTFNRVNSVGCEWFIAVTRVFCVQRLHSRKRFLNHLCRPPDAARIWKVDAFRVFRLNFWNIDRLFYFFLLRWEIEFDVVFRSTCLGLLHVTVFWLCLIFMNFRSLRMTHFVNETVIDYLPYWMIL